MPISDRDQIELYISSSIKNAFARVSFLVAYYKSDKVVNVVKVFGYIFLTL